MRRIAIDLDERGKAKIESDPTRHPHRERDHVECDIADPAAGNRTIGRRSRRRALRHSPTIGGFTLKRKS